MFSPAISRFFRIGAIALLTVSALGGCTGKELRSSLGLKRNDPDEFRVVTRPPLSVPPVYHLRPPAEDEGMNVTPADKRAEALVVEGKELPVYQRPEDAAYAAETAVTSVNTSSLGTAGESVLLQSAGADEAQKDIRKVLKAENRPIILEEKREKGFFGELREKLNPSNEEPLVDAKKEQERIRTNKAEGKPLNDGETAVIDRKNESVLERLF
jgi:hypothetical protein